MNLKMIEVVGRKDAIGKPLLFGTTEEFLKRFDLTNINDLPDYEELLASIKVLEEENNALYNEFEIPDEESEENKTVVENENTKTEIEEKTNVNNENFNEQEEIPDFLKDEKNLQKID